MFESPTSLQDVCLDYICENIEALCEIQPSGPDSSGSGTMVLRGDEMYFPSNLSDLMLASLSEKQKLTDQTMSLFDAQVTRLKRVKIKDAALTTKGLRVLRQHKITELEAMGLKEVTVNDLVGCLGEWTLDNVRTLNVSNSTFMRGSKFSVVVSLSKLKNLHTLNVSYTEFNKHSLEIITEDLHCLENLDISSTPVSDLTPLRKCKQRLKSLCMYNLRASHREDTVPVLCELTELRHLDVSDDFSVQPFVNLQPAKFRVNELLQSSCCLPRLKSLDISGKEGIAGDMLREFLNCHPSMQFLGLALTDMCDLDMFTDVESPDFRTNLQVTGEATEVQIVEALRSYVNRAVYVQRALYHLFSITQSYIDSRIDIIRLILPAMRAHPKELGVQMAATACLYNLSKGELGQKIHPCLLSHIVQLTMDAMSNFPNHQQLQKNSLLTLCSDRILQDVTFNRFRCAKLVMECLCSFDEPSMNRMSVAICSILAAKIPTEQTSQLGARGNYMKKLLMIVRDKMEGEAVDITMKFTLSALWNLTDESPSTCEMFLNEGGLELFLQVLQTYQHMGDDIRIQVETKVLGLINNLAEVGSLRKALMRPDVLEVVRGLLDSKHIDVSYFAAGIVSHLATDGLNHWSVPEISKEDMLRDLKSAVLHWDQPQGEMVAYRSFSPFFPLLTHNEAPEVQLWAVWAIQHVCTKNGPRYCPMLVSEGGSELLLQIISNQDTNTDVVRLATNVLELVNQESIRSSKSS